jgi:hypothetical protein
VLVRRTIDYGYLERLGLIDGAVTPEDISVERAHGRNDNTIVRCKGRSGYFVKRPYPANSLAREALDYEATFCRFCDRGDITQNVRGLLPRLAGYDPDDSAFVYDLFDETVPLWSVYAAPARIVVAAELGKRLAHFHRYCSEFANDEVRGWIVDKPPAAFTIHRPAPPDLSVLSAASHQLISIVQQRPSICEQLDALRAAWKSVAIVHGDIRSENVLVSHVGDSQMRPVVRFVDFETVQFGDPAWDVAGALQDAILFWLFSMTPGADVEKMVASGQYSLSEIQAILRALLNGYFGEHRLERSFIDRAVRFSAVRMLQSAYESAAEEDILPAPAVLLLQIAENVLNDPGRAVRGFYGLA